MAELFLLICLVGVGVLAQYYRAGRERLNGEVKDLERWIDEIIEELEGATEA